MPRSPAPYALTDEDNGNEPPRGVGCAPDPPTRSRRDWEWGQDPSLVTLAQEEEEEEFITSGNWRGKHNSLSRGAGADQP